MKVTCLFLGKIFVGVRIHGVATKGTEFGSPSLRIRATKILRPAVPSALTQEVNIFFGRSTRQDTGLKPRIFERDWRLGPHMGERVEDPRSVGFCGKVGNILGEVAVPFLIRVFSKLEPEPPVSANT